MAEEYHERMILVGAVPDRAETDYGWIDSGGPWTGNGDALRHEPMKVQRFREKPDLKEARALRRQGCLWNTMVITVKAKTLWALGRQCIPEAMCKFDAFLMVLRAVREGRLDSRFEARALASLYNDLGPADMSKDILAHVAGQSLVLRLEGVGWCDWGDPQRVTEALAGLGRHPSFPPHCLECPWESASLANERTE
jgi:mannose-1-phosphate guanylyltransferase